MIRLNKNASYQLLLCIVVIAVVAVVSVSGHAAININEINPNEVKDTIINSLPEGVSLPPELKDIDTNEIFKDGVDRIKEKCNQNSGSDAAFEEASQASTKLMECVQNIIDFSTIQQEIDEAKPNGNLDTVFNKYCNKRNDAIECIENFTASLDPCLTQEEKDQKTVFIGIAKSLLEFTCHENGNQIALFIAEEGPECFESKKDQLQDCFNKTLGKYINNEMPTLDKIPTLVIKEENCRDMDKLEVCVVAELEKCKETTPANLVEALFRFVRKQIKIPNCDKNRTARQGSTGSSNVTRLSINVLLGTWFMALFAKFLVSY